MNNYCYFNYQLMTVIGILMINYCYFNDYYYISMITIYN